MAKLSEITVSISRKLSDDNYGSFGVQAAITLEVEEGEDKDVLYAASASWLSEKVAGTHNAHGTLASQPEAKPTPVPVGAVAKPAPVAQVAQQAVSQVLSNVSQDEDVFNVDTIMVEFMPDGVTKSAKAKGGRWSKYGVKIWPEVLALPPLEWDLEATDAGEYPAPTGLQAVVLMHEGKPRKVLEWK